MKDPSSTSTWKNILATLDFNINKKDYSIVIGYVETWGVFPNDGGLYFELWSVNGVNSYYRGEGWLDEIESKQKTIYSEPQRVIEKCIQLCHAMKKMEIYS